MTRENAESDDEHYCSGIVGKHTPWCFLRKLRPIIEKMDRTSESEKLNEDEILQRIRGQIGKALRIVKRSNA